MNQETERDNDGFQVPPNHLGGDGPSMPSPDAGEEPIPGAQLSASESDRAIEESRLEKSLRNLATAAVEFGKVVGEETVTGAKGVGSYLAKSASHGIARGLEWASATPEEKRGFVHKVVEVLPLIGPNAKYAMAWKRYHAAKGIGDETMMQSARKECLVALSDLGVDIAMLGAAGAVSGIAKAARSILGPAYLARSARVLGAVQVDPVDQVAHEVAKGDRAKRFAEYLLELIPPGTPRVDIESKTEEVAKGIELIVEPEAKPAEPGDSDGPSEGLENEGKNQMH